jgi:tetratricopeptide (TPR) repeat protein
LVTFAIPVRAVEGRAGEIIRAAALIDQGDWRASIAVLEPLLRLNTDELSPTETGNAWNLLGTAYQYVGEYQKARRSFEAALRLLQNSSAPVGQQAAALDNFASLQLEVGQTEAAKKLRNKAMRLYEAEKDHAGIARVSGNLALIALQRGRVKEARRSLAEAFRESALVREPDPDDIAALYGVQCILALHDRELPKALNAAEQAMGLWQHRHGPQYFMLAYGYAVRGEVHDKRGEYPQARVDFENSLSLLARSPGPDSPSYLTVELAYAQVLRDAGSKEEALHIEHGARDKLEELRHRECVQCSLSVLTFR